MNVKQHKHGRGDDCEFTERVTIRVPESMVERIDELVDDGEYDSRTAAIREGCRTVIKGESDAEK